MKNWTIGIGLTAAVAFGAWFLASGPSGATGPIGSTAVTINLGMPGCDAGGFCTNANVATGPATVDGTLTATNLTTTGAVTAATVTTTGAIATGSVTTNAIAATSDAGMVITTQLPPSNAGSGLVVNSNATRTGGNLLDIQNNGASKFKVSKSGAITSGATVQFTLTPGVAGVPSQLVGYAASGDTANSDVYLGSVNQRTTGTTILEVDNGGVSPVFKVSNEGNLWAPGSIVASDGGFQVSPSGAVKLGSLTSNAPDAGIMITTSLAPAAAGSGVLLQSAVQRTAGNLFQINNAGDGVEFYIDYQGNAYATSLTTSYGAVVNSTSTAFAVGNNATNGNTTLFGNRTPGGGDTDVELKSAGVRLAGDDIVRVCNGSEAAVVAAIDYAGKLTANGGLAVTWPDAGVATGLNRTVPATNACGLVFRGGLLVGGGTVADAGCP